MTTTTTTMMINVEHMFMLLVLFGSLIFAKSEVYIVTIEGEPVISYRGGVDGFEATAVDTDQKLDVTSDSVASYSQHLETRNDFGGSWRYSRMSWNRIWGFLVVYWASMEKKACIRKPTHLKAFTVN